MVWVSHLCGTTQIDINCVHRTQIHHGTRSQLHGTCLVGCPTHVPWTNGIISPQRPSLQAGKHPVSTQQHPPAHGHQQTAPDGSSSISNPSLPSTAALLLANEIVFVCFNHPKTSSFLQYQTMSSALTYLLKSEGVHICLPILI